MRYVKKKPLTDYESCKEKALRLLEFRPHSEYELRKKLLMAGANSEDIDKVFEFLRRYSFVNDSQYAKSLANDLSKLKKYGKKRIMQELLNKGIARDLCEEAIQTVETDEETVLLGLMKKKLSGNFERKNQEKAIRYFYTKGYSYDDIKNVIAILKQEEYFDD